MSAFDRYAPFVQDFIYNHNWENLRSIQVAAADAIFNTDENVLLTASTASGKTEAAFFPILTELWENPPASVGAIGPLRALSTISFTALETAKGRISPYGTGTATSPPRTSKNAQSIPAASCRSPESLEALLMHKHAAVPPALCDLRYVVIDEVLAASRQPRRINPLPHRTPGAHGRRKPAPHRAFRDNRRPGTYRCVSRQRHRSRLHHPAL